MQNQAILHSDLNCFYASVETMLNPRLRGKAVAVCGSTEDRHGIVLAKSELAKKAGVKTGMVNWEARQCCRDLIIVPPQYEQYLKYSKLTQAIYQRYTDMVEPFGMDECWLDVTGSQYVCGDARTIAEKIRRSVKEELGLTVSIGVSFNKVFAKLGSDMKKPDAITEIAPESYKEKVWPLPCSDMIYCGPATTKKLARYGIHTIGEVAGCDPLFLKGLLGTNGLALWTYANGRDHSRVMHKDFVSPVKSVGHGITCVSDLENEEEVWKVIFALSQDIGHRLRLHNLATRTVQVHVRGNDLFGSQYQCKLPLKTQLPSEIASAAFRSFKERYSWNTKVRAVTVRAIELSPKDSAEQLTLFDNVQHRMAMEKVQDAVEEIRGRFGKSTITYACLMGDLKMPTDGRDKVKMPGLMYQ
jgi:DNA polymerase-4